MTSPAPKAQRHCHKRGFVLLTTVASATVLLVFIGLALDAGYLQMVKIRMQTAADAAAVGGAQQIRLTGSGASTAASTDAALNGFADGSNGVTVTVNSPPLSGYSSGNPSAVEVLISQTVPPVLMELAGSPSSVVRARAVAGLGNGTACLYTLDKIASGSLSASGGVHVQMDCGIIADSASAQAINVSGGAAVTATSAAVTGNYSISGGATISPLPVTGAPAVNDPLANVPAPVVGGCTQTNLSISVVTRTLDPGVYCNGIAISGGARVTFNPGTYILRGGGLNVSGNSTITGAGVTFYNTSGGGYSYGGINLSGGTVANLSAPATGSLAGMLFFQDRTISPGVPSTFSGGATTIFEGTLYFPTTAVTYSGGVTSSAAYTILVVKTVNFSGGVAMYSDYSSLPGGSPIKGSAVLSE